MSVRRRFPVVSLSLGLSWLLAGCPGGLIGGVLPTGTPTPGVAGATPPGGVGATASPAAFGTPKYPAPKNILPAPGVVNVPSPVPTTDKPASAAPTPIPVPVPGASPLVVPPLVETPISAYALPTLGELAVTYSQTGGIDLISGLGVKFQGLTTIALDSTGAQRYFCDTGNNALRVILETVDPNLGTIKVLQTVATSIQEHGPDGKPIKFNSPRGIGLKVNGDIVLVDSGNQAVRLGTPNPSGPAGTFIFTNLAGGGAAGYVDLIGKDAQFNDPYDVAVDSSGNAYVTDTNNHCIRKITPALVVSTLAGNGTAGNTDGVGKGASFSSPKGIASDPKGVLYVADTGNNVIRKVTSDGVVTTYAGSGQAGFKNALGTAAEFNAPIGLAVDKTGAVYVTEKGSNEVRVISPTGAVTTLAGGDDQQPGWIDGPSTTARFNAPLGLAVDATGIVYAIDSGNDVIRQIQPVRTVTTFSGRGRPLTAPPLLVTLTPGQFPPPFPPAPFSTNPLFPLTSSCCNGPTTAGFVDGDNQTAQFNEPWAVVADDSYNIYVADAGNHAIRKIAPDGSVTTLAGSGHAGFSDGHGRAAQFNTPRALALDGAGNLLVADQLNNCIRRVTPDGSVTTLAGDVAPNHPAGYKDGTLDVASFNNPAGLAIDPAGNVYVADRGNNVIRRIAPNGVVSTIAGDGVVGYKDATTPTTARFAQPSGLALDGKGNLYIADYGNNAIRVISGDTAAVGTLAGGGNTPGITIPGWSDAAGNQALFNDPWSLCVDAQGLVYVADYGNSLIRRVDGQGTAITFAGFIPGYPAVTTGPPISGYGDGPAIGAAFAAPAGICLDRRGYLYVADSQNHRVRKIY